MSYRENAYDGDRRFGGMTDSTHWLVGTMRRNPEALLVLAAGCALLLRGGGSSSSRSLYSRTYADRSDAGSDWGETGRDYSGQASSAVRAVRDGLSDAAAAATEYAGDVKDRVSESAGAYASAASSYA